MTTQTRNRIVEWIILMALLTALVWIAWAGAMEGARRRKAEAAERHFSTSRYVTPPTAFHEPDELTDEQVAWLESWGKAWLNATPEERVALDSILHVWWWRERIKMPISRAKKYIVGGEG